MSGLRAGARLASRRAGAALAAACLAAWIAACARGPLGPAAIDRDHDQCASCRMVISDARTASQVAARGEEPRFYDDPICLRSGLRGAAPLPGGAVVFVVDYRTGEWAPLEGAVFARIPAADTPMASHWVAYSDDPSRRRDPQAEGAEWLPAALFLARGGGEDL